MRHARRGAVGGLAVLVLLVCGSGRADAEGLYQLTDPAPCRLIVLTNLLLGTCTPVVGPCHPIRDLYDMI
jgi:hypothetical protein